MAKKYKLPRFLSLGAVVAVICMGVIASPIVAFASASTASSSNSTTISPAAIKFGVIVAGGTDDQLAQQLQNVAIVANEKPSLVTTYSSFGGNSSAPISTLDMISTRGATPIVTWEPWQAGAGSTQPAYRNTEITAGRYDSYISSWGSALAKWGKPVIIRYAHEMNGSWYPWSDGINGNAEGSYVDSYRHVHDLVTAAGATNVSWMWSPNTVFAGSAPLLSEYPGTAYVDYAGVDGYNWGNTRASMKWLTPAKIFSATLAQLRIVAVSKPIVISEVASTESGGSKATWNGQLLSYLSSQNDVVGFTWFNINKESDWRIESSTESASAFASALSTRR